jgi:hypothetical protein
MREQRRQLWEQRRETEDDEAIEQQMRDLSDKMRRMFTESPLLNRDNVTETVESILPADQVKAGNDRREERRERMREEWEQRREQFGNRFGGRGNDDNDGPGGRGGPRGDRWDNYVQDFSRRHNLDETQASTADSLLRDLKGQRDTYLESHASDLEAVREIEDRQARRDRYEELNAPVESLFESLQTKLDQIPTAAQKAEAESRRPTSRPARRGGPSSRPST